MARSVEAAEFESRLQALVKHWLTDADIAAAYLFGSRSRGTPRSGSDVDLAVTLRTGLTPSQRWHKRLDLIGSASSLLGRNDIDLVILEEAPALLGHRVLRDGRLLLDRDARRRVQIHEYIVGRYLDEKPLRAALDAGLKRRIREGRFAR